MPDIPYFGEADANRIAANTRWGEDVRERTVNFIDHPTGPQSETIFVRLQEKDPPNFAGYWSGSEVVWKKDAWEFAEPDRFFNGEENDYIRHKDFEDLQAGMIVLLKIIVNTEDGTQEFVILRDVTNPEAFVLYGPEGQNAGSSLKDWHMLRGGKVLTNVGELALAETTLGVGYLGVECVFIEQETMTGSLGQGTAETMKTFIMVSAAYTNVEGPYWVAEDDYSSVTVNHPIATIENKNGFARLTQHHAGDIHLEINASGPSTEISLKCIKWIGCSKTGNEYTIKHKGPFSSCPHSYEGHIGFDPNEFSCDEISGGAELTEVIEWINANLIRIAQNLKWDEKGHIYGKDNCDGSTIYEDDDDDDDDDDEDYGDSEASMTSIEHTAPPLTLALAEHEPASFLVPYVIDPNSGIDSTYWILNGDGTPNLKPIETGKLIQFSILNSLGESMVTRISDVQVFKQFYQNKALLVSGVKTGGWEFPDVVEPFYSFSAKNFRFNDEITITGSIVAKGFPVTLEHNTLSVSDLPAFLPSNILRDLTDPLMEPFEYENFYSLQGMNGHYANEISFEWQGVKLNFSIDGGKSFQDTILLEITGLGQVVSVHEYTFDFIGQDVEQGDIITLVSKLLTQLTLFSQLDGSEDGYDANVTSKTKLFYKEETECVDDGVETVGWDEAAFLETCVLAEIPTPANPCTPNFCGGDPSIQITVTGAAGTINWLGETWNLPADSGVTKCVCPTNYDKGGITTPVTYLDEQWTHQSGAGTTFNLLRLRRDYSQNFGNFGGQNRLEFQFNGSGGQNDKMTTFSGTSFISTFQIGILNAGVPIPTKSDYDILDSFFGSFTTGGITFAWARGEDWDV